MYLTDTYRRLGDEPPILSGVLFSSRILNSPPSLHLIFTPACYAPLIVKIHSSLTASCFSRDAIMLSLPRTMGNDERILIGVTALEFQNPVPHLATPSVPAIAHPGPCSRGVDNYLAAARRVLGLASANSLVSYSLFSYRWPGIEVPY